MVIVMYSNRVKNIEIPESIKELDYIAFQSCTSLEEIIIPSNVTTIGKSAFSLCYSLEKIRYNATAANDLPYH